MAIRIRNKKERQVSPRQRAGGAVGSAPVFTYRSARSEQPATLGRHAGAVQSDVGKNGLKFWLNYWAQRVGFILGGIALVVCVIEILWLTPNVKVIAVDSASKQYFLHSMSSYQRAASQLFAKSLSSSNKITVNTATIARQLEAAFPELTNVSVALPLIGHRPIVYIQAVKPALILVTNGGPSFVVNKDGRVEADASSVTNLKRLAVPVVHDRSGVILKLGATALSSEDVSFITTVLQELVHGNIAVGNLSLPAASRELDMSIQNQPFYVKFNLESDSARQQAGTFLATWHYLKQHNQVPSQYIDVRVDGRAYYK